MNITSSDLILQSLVEELGSAEVENLFSLLGWIRGEKLSEWRNRSRQRDELFWKTLRDLEPRPAPSIITRSEAELFGLSTPRFAFRITIRDRNDNLLGFANLRRISSLKESIGRRLGLDKANDFLTRFHSRCKSLGDCYLSPSARWPKHSVIATPLAESYGEAGPQLGVPFVTHFPIGGGMCAQAVCFQATALMHAVSNSVLGVSEVTCLSQATSNHGSPRNATCDTSVEILDFSGLKPSGIGQYFQHDMVGLQPICQALQVTDKSPIGLGNVLDKYASALAGYVRSGVPVIAAVQMAKLTSSGIYDDLGRRPIDPGPGGHAILIVGCDPEGRRFLVNDPATFPFLEIGIEDLFRSFCNGTQLIAIHPKGVTVLLLTQVDEKGIPVSVGVIERSSRTLGGPLQPKVPSEWYLDVGQACFGTEVVNRPSWVATVQSHVSEFRTQHSHFQRTPFWVQVQNIDSSYVVVLWNAADINSKVPIDAKVVSNTIVLETTKNSMQQPVPKNDTRSLKESGIEVGVITSFSTKRSFDAFRCLSKWKGLPHNTPVELYLWMQPDVDWILKHVGYVGRESFNSVEYMADFCASTAIESTLRRLSESLSSVGGIESIAAIATFIPEISCDPESARGVDAQKSLEYVFRFAIALHDSQPECRRIRTIECVAGSRIDEVFSCMTASTYPRLIARTVSDEEARRRLFRNLKAAGSGGLYRKLRERGISLAIELEPGPLFVLRDTTTLASICNELEFEKDEDIRGVVGVNLDITHWRFARIDPQVMLQAGGVQAVIARRIAHCHMSGHHATAHFGDRQLLPKDQWAFDQWREVLYHRQSIAKAARGQLKSKLSPDPLYSGLISLEYEAAVNPNAARQSLAVLEQWIN